MPQLIQMRERIKTIGTIKKITHAMRLISMSGHSKLSHQAPFIQNYKDQLLSTFQTLKRSASKWESSLLNPKQETKRTLIIVIGSKKGLCGTFNSNLLKFIEQNIKSNKFENPEFLVIGKKAVDYMKKRYKLVASYENLTTNTITKIANELFNFIKKSNPSYTKVVCYSNYPKNFFTQIPTETQLIPIKDIATENAHASDDYYWPQPIDEVLTYLAEEYLHFTIQALLFDSLFAEQAARFQSMDNATRNAETLLETMKIQYNKLRQTKITGELIELSASFQGSK